MNLNNIYRLSYLLVLAASIFLCSSAYAGVFVYDGIGVEDRPAMLRAVTKGKYFKKGGELVEFFINGKFHGKSLSGGDATAYIEFRPAKAGAYKLIAKSKDEKDEGAFLIIKKGSHIVFVDVAGSLVESPFSKKPIGGSRDAIKQILNSYPIVYVDTGTSIRGLTRKWLRDHDFPSAPLLDWDGGGVFEEAASLGLQVRVIIGDPDVIKSAEQYKPLTFSFKDTDEIESVKDWADIKKEILKQKP